MSNLIQYTGRDIQVADELLIKLKKLNILKRKVQEAETQFRLELKQAMEQYGVSNIKNEVFNAQYISEKTRVSYDGEKVKQLIEDCGLFVEDYQKEIPVQPHIRMDYK